MKNPAFILSIFCICLLPVGLSSQAITTPRAASPAAVVKQTIGISTIKVEYSRPSVRGRKIWGELVPYGYTYIPFGGPHKAPWRAGANENTVLTLSHHATIQGVEVPAGKYGLFYTINEDNTGEVILSKDYQSWGNYFYDPARDQMRAPITITDHAMTESLTFEFDHLTDNTAQLNLNWEKKQFPVMITFDVASIVIENAKNELMSDKGFNWQSYHSAAVYAMGQEDTYPIGLEWAIKAVEWRPNYETLSTKASLLLLNGKPEEAEAARMEANKLATEEDLNAYGYHLLNNKLFDKAIEVFQMNTSKYPESANAWDSLGEAYALSGDKKNAIKAFKKSMSLNPSDQVRANSEKYLKMLESN